MSEFRQPSEARAVQSNTITTDYHHEYTARVGCLVQPDNWGCAVPLEPCEWTPAQFRITGNSGACSAINVTLTGRTVQRLNSFTRGVRCRIEFVQDGEPSIMHVGWMLVD